VKGDSIEAVLQKASVFRETIVDQGIQFIRKKEGGHRNIYMIANNNDHPFEGWLPLTVEARSVVVYDPMTGDFGKGQVSKTTAGHIEVFVQLAEKQTLIIETYQTDNHAQPFRYFKEDGQPIKLNDKWKITFLSGGPVLPPTFESDTLTSWTNSGPEYGRFSGTAVYTTTFQRPTGEATGWMLDLGMSRKARGFF
jgi:hypothetical protein